MMDLVNAPANKKPPQHLAAWAIESGRKHGYDVKVYELKELQEMGMGRQRIDVIRLMSVST